MPIYTCTTAESTLNLETKAALATEITHIHSVINHVPSTYVNVVFNELPAGNVYTDAAPAQPLLITGWVRDGHPEDETSRLATEIAAAATRITGIPRTECWSSSRAARPITPSKAAVSYPHPAKKRHGSPPEITWRSAMRRRGRHLRRRAAQAHRDLEARRTHGSTC